MKQSNELTNIPERSLAVPDPELLREVMESAFSPGEKMDVFMLPRIKMPTGGGQYWIVPDGPPVKELMGIILLRHGVNSYWDTEFEGGGTPPRCQSLDKVHGIGEPGGECAICPLLAWNSGRNGGKACQEKTRLFLLTDGSLLPWMLTLPATAYKDCQAYCASRATWRMKTIIGLEVGHSRSGFDFAHPVFKAGERLSPSDRAAVEQYRADIIPMLRSMPVAGDEEI